MTPEERTLLDAQGIAETGPTIAYNTMATSERVRVVVRGLLSIIKDLQFKIDCERDLTSTLSQRKPT